MLNITYNKMLGKHNIMNIPLLSYTSIHNLDMPYFLDVMYWTKLGKHNIQNITWLGQNLLFSIKAISPWIPNSHTLYQKILLFLSKSLSFQWHQGIQSTVLHIFKKKPLNYWWGRNILWPMGRFLYCFVHMRAVFCTPRDGVLDTNCHYIGTYF